MIVVLITAATQPPIAVKRSDPLLPLLPCERGHLTYAVSMLGLLGAYALRERMSIRLLAESHRRRCARRHHSRDGAARVRRASLRDAHRHPIRFKRGLPPFNALLLIRFGSTVRLWAIALAALHAVARRTKDFGLLRAITAWFTQRSPLVNVLGWRSA